MQDPREFTCTDDALINDGYGYNRNEEDLYLDEIILDEDVEEEN